MDPSAPAPAAPPSPKIRVLVADDEETIASTLATILDLSGYEVCAVYGGEAALKLLDLFKPDLLITDVSMPGVTGIELASVAQSTLPRCKVLLFTGHAGLHGLLRAADQENLPYDVLMKPVRPEDLLAKLKATMGNSSPALLVPIDVDGNNIH